MQERVDHIGAGHGPVGGDRQGVTGVVVEPGQDLDLGAVGEGPVGEVGLPALVGQVGFEVEVGGLWPFLRLGLDEAGAFQSAPDRRCGDRDVVMVLQVPGDGVGAGVEPFRSEPVT